MGPRLSMRHALFLVAATVAVLVSAAGIAAAGGFTGAPAGTAIPSNPTPAEPPSSSPPPSNPPPSSPPPSSPAPSPTGSPPVCTECQCPQPEPEPSMTAPGPEVVAPARYRRNAPPPGQTEVTYTFTFTTDDKGVPTLGAIKAAPADYRADIDSEQLLDDNRGCYLLFFDSRTAVSLVRASGSYVTKTNDNSRTARVVPLTKQDLFDDNRIPYSRWPYSIGPRVVDATFTITVVLTVRNR